VKARVAAAIVARSRASSAWLSSTAANAAGDVAAVDGGEDLAGARPAVAGGEAARGAEGVGVMVGEDPVVVGRAFGRRQQPRPEVVADLLLGDPRQFGEIHQPPPPDTSSHLDSVFEAFRDRCSGYSRKSL
jgi:hypothetical protein